MGSSSLVAYRLLRLLERKRAENDRIVSNNSQNLKQVGKQKINFFFFFLLGFVFFPPFQFIQESGGGVVSSGGGFSRAAALSRRPLVLLRASLMDSGEV